MAKRINPKHDKEVSIVVAEIFQTHKSAFERTMRDAEIDIIKAIVDTAKELSEPAKVNESAPVQSCIRLSGKAQTAGKWGEKNTVRCTNEHKSGKVFDYLDMTGLRSHWEWCK